MLRRHFLCDAPSIDLDALEDSRKEFYNKALPVMLNWVEIVTSEVQYDDVMKILKSCNLPYCHEGYFCQRELLPKLKGMGKLSNLPVKLLAILYTIDT